jgi:hypothetical protein
MRTKWEQIPMFIGRKTRYFKAMESQQVGLSVFGEIDKFQLGLQGRPLQAK